MKKTVLMLCAVLALISLPSCDKESDNPSDGGTAGLSATAQSLKLLAGAEASVVLNGGTLPYVIVSQSDPAVASASLDSRTLLVTAGALGTATIKVRDSAPAPKSIDVTVTVVSSYTTGIAGSFQFQSDRGAYSVSGIGSIGAAAPASGSGVVALSDYDGLVVIAYTVVSPTRYDMATVLFLDSKSIAPGDYTYPTAGNRQVQISYMPNQDPADTSDTFTGYILANSGFASVTAMVNGAVSGTFSGNGFFVNREIGADHPGDRRTVRLSGHRHRQRAAAPVGPSRRPQRAAVPPPALTRPRTARKHERRSGSGVLRSRASR